MLRQKFRFLGPCWVFLRTVWVWEAKKKSKIFLDLARKKLCHVVGNIFVSNFVMYRKIPSHHLGGDIWVWSFFFKRLFFRFFLGLCGPTGPIFTTAGGGLGVLIVATTLGYHLGVILLIWDFCSRRYGPGSDWGRTKVENFFEPMTSGNSLFCRYCVGEQKTHSYYSLILRILGCGGRQSWKFEQKNDVKKYFPGWDMGCAKWSHDRDKQKSDSCWLMKVTVSGCRRPQSGLSHVIFSSFFGLFGPTGPIFTTAGGGLGVLIVDLTVGYHLEVIRISWDLCSRR